MRKKVATGLKFQQYQGASPRAIHGQANDKGQIYSENYGKWVDPKIFEMDKKIGINAQAQKEANQYMRDQAWDKYYQKNAEPPDKGIYDAQKQYASTLAKNAILEKMEKFKGGISPELVNIMEKQMNAAIEKGASPEDLKGIANNFYKQHLNEQEAVKAEAALDELDAEFGLQMSKAGLVVATAPLGIGGAAIGVGAFTYGGYAAGNTKEGFIEGVKMYTPGASTYDWYQSYKQGKSSGYGVIPAVLFDGLAGMGLFADYKALKSGNIFGEELTLAAKAGQNIDEIFDAAKAAQTAEMNSLKGKIMAENKVGQFRGAYNEAINDALRKGKTFKLDDYPEVRDTAIKVMQDKNAMHVLNDGFLADIQKGVKTAGKDEFINAHNAVMKEIYRKGDNLLKEDLISKYKGKYGPDIDVEYFKATNPKKPGDTVKASYDRDVSAKIIDKKTGKVLTEVPEEVLHKSLADTFYEAAGKPPVKSFDPYGVGNIWKHADGKPYTPAEIFTKLSDQAPTYSKSADAYGSNLYQAQSALMPFKQELFANQMDLGYTFGHKGFEWFRDAEELSKLAKEAEAAGEAGKANVLKGYAEAFKEEGARQITKQWKNQIKPGVQKVEQACDMLGIEKPKRPMGFKESEEKDRVVRAMELMEAIGKTDKNGQIITTELVNFQLKQVCGYNGMENAVAHISDFVKGYENVVNANKPLKEQLLAWGKQSRAAYNADIPNYPEKWALMGEP